MVKQHYKYAWWRRIRDSVFRLLFPAIAMHESHLVDDCIEMALRIRELEEKEKPAFKINILTDSNCKTTWCNYETGV